MILPIPFDPRLPSLAAAFDGDAVGEILARRLRGGAAIASCRPVYVRYKPGTRGVVLYEVAIERCSGRADAPPTTTLPVHLTIGPDAEAWARRPSLAHLVERSARHQGAGPLDRSLWLPEMGALAQVFPVDRRLPALVHAASRKRMRRELGGRPASIEIVRYKPGRKALLRYTCASGDVPRGIGPRTDGPPSVLYGKVHPGERSGERIATLGALLAAAGAPTPAPAAYIAALRLILHPAVPGRSLRSDCGTAGFADHLPAAADALARFQAAGRRADVAALALPDADPHGAALGAAGLIATIRPDLAGRTRDLVRRLAYGLADAAPDARTLIHGDFYDDQIIIDGDAAWLIDLDEAGFGHPAGDVANFAAHVSAWPGVPASMVDDARSRWLDLWPIERARDHKLRLYLESAALVSLAVAPFRQLAPDWPAEVERRLGLAEGRCGEAEGIRTTSRPESPPPPAVLGEGAGGWGPLHAPTVLDPMHAEPAAMAPEDSTRQPPSPPFHDPALPQMDELLDPRRMADLLAHGAGAAMLGGRLNVRAITLVRHKPGRRCVIRYDVAIDDGGVAREASWFGKTFASRRGGRVYAAHAAVAARQAFGPAVRVPEPIAYLPDVDLCLLGAVPGRSIAEALAAGEGSGGAAVSGAPGGAAVVAATVATVATASAATIAVRIADALHALHTSDLVFHRRHGLDDELRPLAARVAGLAAACPALGDAARRCLDALNARAGGLAAWRRMPAHRDFYPDQVLVDAAGGLAVLDLDDAALTDPAVDVANFTAHLRLVALQVPVRREAALAAADAFLSRYRDLDAEIDLRTLRFLEAATCLRLAAIHVGRSNGALVAAGLLDACSMRIDEADRVPALGPSFDGAPSDRPGRRARSEAPC